MFDVENNSCANFRDTLDGKIARILSILEMFLLSMEENAIQ